MPVNVQQGRMPSTGGRGAMQLAVGLCTQLCSLPLFLSRVMLIGS